MDKFKKISSRADWLKDKDTVGKLVKDVSTGAMGGAAAGALGAGVGAAPGALLGAAGGLGLNLGEAASFAFYGNEKKLAWLAGDLQDKLNMIGGATDNPEIKSTTGAMGAGFKNFIDHYIRDERIDSLAQNNIFANKAAAAAYSTLDTAKAEAVLTGAPQTAPTGDATGALETSGPTPGTTGVTPESPAAGQTSKVPSAYDQLGWADKIGKAGEVGNIYGLNPANTDVDEYQFGTLKENDPDYKWIQQGQNAYLNNIAKIKSKYPNMSTDEAMLAHLKKNQQSEQFAQYIMNELKKKEAAGDVVADTKFVGRVVTSAVREFNNLAWGELSELFDSYGMYHLADKIDNRIVIAADAGEWATNTGLGLTGYPLTRALNQYHPGNIGQQWGALKSGVGAIRDPLQSGITLKGVGKQIFTKGNVLNGLLGAGVAIGANYAWDKLTQLDKNHVVQKSIEDSKDIIKDMRAYTKQLNSFQKQALDYALSNMEKYITTIDQKLYSATATSAAPWKDKDTETASGQTAPAVPPWQQSSE